MLGARGRKWSLAFIMVALAVLCVFCISGHDANAVALQEIEVNEQGVLYHDTYAVGETITIKRISARSADKELKVTAVLQKDHRVEAVLSANEQQTVFVFKEEGEYCLIYTAESNGSKQVIKNYNIAVKKQPYFNALFVPVRIGTTVDVSARCYYEGESVAASIAVTDPVGRSVKVVNSSFIASLAGFYRIVYSADMRGTNFRRTYMVEVLKNESPPQSYGDYFTFFAEDCKMIEHMDAPDYSIGGSGLGIVSESSELSFRFNNVIDLNAMTVEDSLIKLLPLGSDGYSPFQYLNFSLIDAYDAGNVITYYAWPYFYNNPTNGNTDHWVYYRINYNGKSGVYGDDGKFNTWGAMSNVHFSTDLLHSHQGGKGYGKAAWFEPRIDYAARQFYALCGNSAYTPELRLLADLTDPVYTGANNEWGGFTTGEVYLQVNVASSGAGCGMIVSEVGGEKLNGSFGDPGRMPAGFQLENDYGTEFPDGIRGEKYPVPKVLYATDAFDGLVYNPEFAVSAEYNTSGIYLPISDFTLDSDHAFTPARSGEYRFVYTVSDLHGNLFARKISFTVKETLGVPGVSYDEAALEDLKVGETMVIPRLNAVGMSALTLCKESIVYNGAEYADMAGEHVFLSDPGEVAVSYRYVDYLGQVFEGEKSYRVTAAEEPIIQLKSAVPKYVLKGREIVLPDFSAFDYSKQGETGYSPERSILVDGQEIDLMLRRVRVTKEDGEEITVTYKAGDKTVDYSVTVVDAQYMADRFFATSGEITKSNERSYVQLDFSGNTVIDFINPLVVPEKGAIDLQFNIGGEVFDKSGYLDVIFTDYIYGNNIFVRITRTGDALYGQLNGRGEKVPLAAGDLEGYYSLPYNQRDVRFDSLFGISSDSKEYPFAGFKSRRLNLQFAFSEIVAESGYLRVASINGRELVSQFNGSTLLTTNDFGAPEIVAKESLYDNDFVYGRTVKIPAIEAWTVLSGMSVATLRITAPSGTVVADGINAYSDYYLELAEYGQYSLRYSSAMGNGMELINAKALSLTVKKDSLPEIALQGLAKSYFKGDVLEIPDVTVSQAEKDYVVTMYLIMPSAKCVSVHGGDLLRLNSQGTYVLAVTVSDKFNTVSYSYRFGVIEKR